MPTIEFGTKNTPTFNFSFTKGGVAYDLTGASVTFTAKILLPPFDNKGFISKACDVQDPPTGGLASCTLTSVETSVPGTYEAELFLHFAETEESAERSQTSKRFEIKIVETLTRA